MPNIFESPATALALAEGAATYDGAITAPGQVQVFSLQMQAGQGYEIWVDAFANALGTLPDPFLSIRDANGNIVAWVDDSNREDPFISFQPSSAGTYYLCVEDTNLQDTGTFRLQVKTDQIAGTGTATTLLSGQTYHGSLDRDDTGDWFRVDLVKGSQYFVDFSYAPDDTPDPSYADVRLVDPQGDPTYVQFYDGGGLFTAGATGTYFVSATLGMQQGSGSYDISFAAATPSAKITPGGQATGTLSGAGDARFYSFSVPDGAADYSFSVSGSAGSHPQVEVFYLNGEAMTISDASNGFVRFSTDLAGTYMVRVAATSAADAGSFTLRSNPPAASNPDVAGATAATAATLEVGTTTDGRFEYSTDVDWYAVKLTAGQSYSFSIDGRWDGGSNDAHSLALYDSQGNYAGGGTQDGIFTATPPATGTYYLSAQSWGARGAYDVSVKPATGDASSLYITDRSAAVVDVGANLFIDFDRDIARGQGTIYLQSIGGEVVETFDVATSDRVSVSGHTVTIDPTEDLKSGERYELVFPSWYTLTAANGTGSLGTSEALDFTAGVSAPPQNPSGENAATSIPIVVGGTAWGHAGSGPWFAVRLGAGQAYSIEAHGTGAFAMWNPELRLYDTAGNVVASDVSDPVPRSIQYTVAQTGTYYIHADDSFGPTRDVLVSVAATGPDTAAPALVDTAQSGTLLSATFSEQVKLGAGTITIIDKTGNPVGGFDLATSNRIKVSGATVTVDGSAAMAPGQEYHLKFSAGSILDMAGNAYTGEQFGSDTVYGDDYAGDASTQGVLDVHDGTVSGRSETGLDIDWFSIGMLHGHQYTFTLTTPATNAAPSLAIYDGFGRVVAHTFPSSPGLQSLKLDFDSAVPTPYFLQVTMGAVAQYTVAVADSFVPDTVPPAIGSMQGTGPYHVDSQLRFSCTEGIHAGPGSIEIRDSAGNLVETIAASDTDHVTFVGAGVWVDLPQKLSYDAAYSINFAADSLLDFAGNSMAGSQQLHFSTEPKGITVDGTDGADTLYGSQYDDTLDGKGGNDFFNAGSRGDSIDGGAGIDTASFYFNLRESYGVQQDGDTLKVVSFDGTETLVNVERLQFLDYSLAFDLEGDAGEAYRLYQAAFNRVPDLGGLGYQIHALDSGLTLTQVAQNFINSPEFSATYGTLDNTGFVTQLYANVLHRLPDSGGLAYHVARLESGVSRADVLIGFSESPENKAAVIGAIEHGITYIQ